MPREDTGRLAGARQPPRTTCKICWKGVYSADETAWVVSPNPGIAHETCARKKTAKG